MDQFVRLACNWRVLRLLWKCFDGCSTLILATTSRLLLPIPIHARNYDHKYKLDTKYANFFNIFPIKISSQIFKFASQIRISTSFKIIGNKVHFFIVSFYKIISQISKFVFRILKFAFQNYCGESTRFTFLHFWYKFSPKIFKISRHEVLFSINSTLIFVFQIFKFASQIFKFAYPPLLKLLEITYTFSLSFL